MMKIILIAAFIVCAAGQTPPPDSQALLAQLRAIFNRMDGDNNGELTLLELETYFDQDVDTNGDGKMSLQEFEASRSGPGGAVGPTPPPGFSNATFLYYDTLNGTQAADGFVTRGDTAFFFKILDRNGDGDASLAEFDEAFEEIGAAIARVLQRAGNPPVGK